ncbi:MAG: radical SAM protein [Myxococcales bacterium]|nr:radical SAM protein [Myxococcales bacterium]
MATVLIAVPPMRASSQPPQLGVGYLASALRKAGHIAHLVHCDAQGVGPEALVELVMARRPDVVAFTVVTMAWPVTRRLTRMLRDRGFAGPIVLGGNHVTALPDYALRQSAANVVVRNEGDVSFPLLVDALASGRALAGVPGITWSDDGVIRSTKNAPTVEDLDTIPFPAWDLMRPATFPYAPHQLLARQYPVAPIATSRGCPYACTYCASQGLWGRTWRHRSIDNVMQEIELLVAEYGVRELHFEDDELLAREERVLELCDRIASANLGITWSLPNGVRTNAITDRVAKAMARAGCYEVGLGIDAPFEHQQRRVNKRRPEGAAERAIEIIQRHGMEVRGFWILGHDVDQEDDVERQIEYILSLPAEFGAFGVSAPLPGSPDFEQFRRTVDLDTFDWDKISYFKALDTPNIPRDRLQAMLRSLVLRFYGRPKQLRAVLRRVKPQQVRYLARGLHRYLTGTMATEAS